jgi:P27 family predicted phage terminase small subunit
MVNNTKPTTLKKLEGTYRKDRAVKNEVQPTIEVGLAPPADLNEWGAKYWTDIMSEYGKIGLITRVDVGALHSVCYWFGLMNEAADIVSAKGLEVQVEKHTQRGDIVMVTETNPMIAVADKAFKNYIAMCKEFGLTPASRTKISAPDHTPKDEFAEFDN